MERKLQRLHPNAPKAMLASDVKGKIKFIHRTGYGFVRRNGTDDVAYVPRSEFRRNPNLSREGQAVIFDVETARLGPRAINLRTDDNSYDQDCGAGNRNPLSRKG